MKTLLAFTMTPTEPMITILAGTLIIAGVALLVMFHLLHEARHEREQAIKNAMTWTDEAAKLQAENNLFAAKLSTYDADRVHQWATSKALTKAQEENKQWKATYYEQLNRANRFETLYTRMTKRPRDPKTGRIVAAKTKPDPALTAFDDMMDNAIDKLKGLTVRNLCDEIKANAVNDVR